MFYCIGLWCCPAWQLVRLCAGVCTINQTAGSQTIVQVVVTGRRFDLPATLCMHMICAVKRFTAANGKLLIYYNKVYKLWAY